MAGKMNALDRLIGWLSPQAFCRRMAWREEQKRYYDAARTDRFGASWFPPGSLSSENTDRPYRTLIRGRARDLERNNGIVRGLLRGLERNVVGAGIAPQPDVTSRSGRSNDALNRRIAELWADWSQRRFCDVAGASSFPDFQRLYLRRRIVDGDVFVIVVAPPEGGAYPVALQMIEPDLLAEDVFQTKDGHKVFGGVEVDEFMRPLAYHFRMDPLESARTIRVPAERVVHGYDRTRAPQLRGVSELAGSMESIRDIGEYVDSELKAARIAGSMTGVVKTETGAARIGRAPARDANGAPIETIQLGSLNYLKQGEEVNFPQPGRPNEAAGGFVSVIERFVGVGMGLSYEAVSRDLSQVNYSSIREGRLQDIKTYEEYQRDVVETFCAPVYAAWLDAMVLNGLVTIPGYWGARDKYRKVRWVRPGWSWVDPQKEAAAAEKGLQLGTTTLQEVCGYEGKDWQEVLRQRKAEQDFIAEIGLNTGGDHHEPGSTPSDAGTGAAADGTIPEPGDDA
ncbi:phage portal protein, lambda family [Pyramidobacter piscolens W5455]|uniref:Phage portal protein, lambda family n=1 Tax=Pyramidobacter piscolens W5455 TaxID=352165 RepID=A0ABM9ZWU6_9BACT|nr:phage portal protein [Pyramidobacter piscolens]EFB91348.1 phage portal protein, lambda family [Pyramidobacter piscolens W5455]